MSDQDIFKQTTDVVSVTEQSPEPNYTEQTSMANALWVDGHKHGYEKGWKNGYKNGSSAFGHSWVVLLALLVLFGGFALGVGGNFIARCGPEIPCTVQMPNWGFAPINVEEQQ